MGVSTRASSLSCPQALCTARKCPGDSRPQSRFLPGPRLSALPGEKGQLEGRSQAAPGGASPAAPWASGPGPPQSGAGRRAHCSRPTLASSQPPPEGDSKSVVPARAGGMDGPGALPAAPRGQGRREVRPPPAHRTSARPRPPGTAPGSHTAAPGGHTAPHRRSVQARRSSEATGWTAGAGGRGPRAQEGGRPALWAGAGVRRAGRGCALLLGWGVGRPAGSPGTGLQWSDRMRSSRPTTPPGPVCPARKIWGRTGSGAPQHPAVIPRPVCPRVLSPECTPDPYLLLDTQPFRGHLFREPLPSSGLPFS